MKSLRGWDMGVQAFRVIGFGAVYTMPQRRAIAERVGAAGQTVSVPVSASM